MKVVVNELVKGLNLYRRRRDQPEVSFIYELDNSTMKVCNFEYNFTGSVNISIRGNTGLVVTKKVMPFERKVLAIVHADDPTQGWSLRSRWKYTLEDPPREQMQELIAEKKETIKKEEATAEEVFGPLPVDTLPVEEIIAACAKHNIKFFDLDFEAENSSLYPSPEEAGEEIVQWRRTDEFMKVNPDKGLTAPDVFVDGIDPGDIRQGALGDCWFMCALSSLAERPELVETLFNTKSYNSEGVYRLHFCKNGEWINVTVDDWFPCFPGSGPIYSRSRGNELWVLLMEKAYAKLHGSYALLRGGWANEGMIDLTGCPGSRYTFADADVAEQVQSGAFFDLLLQFDQRGYLMSASTPGEDRWSDVGGRPQEDGQCVGLVPGHAYTVLQAKEPRPGIRLLCIRNPWGSFEWNGDWSDKSPLWTPELREELQVVSDPEDGTFWMAFEDFVQHFDSMNVNRVRQWSEHRFKGLLVNRGDVTVSNRVFELRVSQPTRLFLGVHQEDSRVQGVSTLRPYLDLGAVVFQKKANNKIKVVDQVPLELDRQAQAELELQPGTYLVMPRSTGCRFQQEEGASRDPHPFFRSGGQAADPDFLSIMHDIFRKYDVGMNQRLGFQELAVLVHDAGEPDLSPDQWDSLWHSFCGSEEGIPFRGVMAWILTGGKETVRPESDLRRILKNLGYEDNMWSSGSRCYVMSVHAECPVEVQVTDLDAFAMSEEVESAIIRKYGTSNNPASSVQIYTLYSPLAHAYSYAVENRSASSINFTLDSSNSSSLFSSFGNLVCTKRVNPGQTLFFQHLQATHTATSYSTAWRASWTR